MSKNFLITGYYFDGYHGSMMHMCELTKELINKGFHVYIATAKLTTKIKKYVKNEIGAEILHFSKIPLDIEYEYVLSYQEPLTTYLLDKGLKYKHMGLGSLSTFSLLDVPSILALQGFPVFVHSEEHQQQFIKDFNSQNIHIFRNSTPKDYTPIAKTPTSLRKIAIISNHVPDELSKVSKKLIQNGYIVDLYGKNHNYKRVTREVLSKYDLIISIGKTVQYSLYMGIPVYNYDYFGGCGYLTKDNIEKAEYYNFSGRDCKRVLTDMELYEEITKNYDIALFNIKELQQRAFEKYNLSKNTFDMLSVMDSTNLVISDTAEWHIYKTRCRQFCEYIIRQQDTAKVLAPAILLLAIFYKLINTITLKKCYKNRTRNLFQLLDEIKNY